MLYDFPVRLSVTVREFLVVSGWPIVVARGWIDEWMCVDPDDRKRPPAI